MTTDQYDAGGNTIGSGVNTGTSGYVYDFENRLVQQAGISIVYDGDGNRVSKTTANGTTKYLVDELNPTGYAQVLDEVQSTSVIRTYTWGLDLISQTLPPGSPLATGHSPLSYYVFDGHGSVRALTNAVGAITDTYDYDAFGNLIHSTGTTPNNYLFAGEQFDADLNLYYNRARYLSTSTGRFWTMDTFEGNDQDPLSAHKYLYAEADPIDNSDPSGKQIDDIIATAGVGTSISAISILNYNPFEHQFRTASTISARGMEFIRLQEDFSPVPYNDRGPTSGNCTIGYGHKMEDHPCTWVDYAQYPNGISRDAAEQQLFQDVNENAIYPIRFLVTVPLAQKEFDALADFAFNIGPGNNLLSLQKGRGLASTTLLRQLNSGYYSAVPPQLHRFVYSGKQRLTGLVHRRNDEATLWITGIYYVTRAGKFVP